MRLPLLTLLLASSVLAQARPEDPRRDPPNDGEACGAAIGQVFERLGLERRLGVYLHVGGGRVDGGWGPGVAVGVFHHTLVGGDVEVTTRSLASPRVAVAARFVPLRLGLDRAWVADHRPPDRALLVSLRAGGVLDVDSGALGPVAGLDLELMLSRRLTLGVRTSIMRVARVAGEAPSIAPSALLVVGIAPATAYD